MQLIIDVIGMPNASVLSRSSRKNLFSQFKSDNTAVPPAIDVISDSEKEKRFKMQLEEQKFEERRKKEKEDEEKRQMLQKVSEQRKESVKSQ